MKPLIFIIINYNTPQLVKKLLDNVKGYRSIKKIYVVDNGSTDQSYKQLKKYETKKIEILEEKENKGFSHGMNLGAKKAIKEFGECDLLFSNTDIVIYSDENIKRLQRYLDEFELALIGPVVYQGKEISRGWKIPNCKQECFENLPGIGKHFLRKNQGYPEDYYKGKVSFTEAVSGCFFLIKSKVLEDICFFDENVFLYYEENILGCKLKEKKYRVGVCNEVVILHEHSVSVDHNMGYLRKYILLKESQRYFEMTYNRASKIDLFFLQLTANLTKITIYVRLFLKGEWKK